MKKMLAIAMLAVMLLGITGCSDDKERIENAAERAIDLQYEAQDAVDDMNEDTKRLEQEAQELELE